MKTTDKYKEAIEREAHDFAYVFSKGIFNDGLYSGFISGINSDLNEKIIEIERREFAIEMVNLILDILYIHKDDYTRRRFLESLQTELTKLKSKI